VTLMLTGNFIRKNQNKEIMIFYRKINWEVEFRRMKGTTPKAFIDMFVQRFAKAIAVAISLGITMTFGDFASLRWLSLITIAVVVLWVYAAVYAGRRFKELTE